MMVFPRAFIEFDSEKVTEAPVELNEAQVPVPDTEITPEPLFPSMITSSDTVGAEDPPLPPEVELQ